MTRKSVVVALVLLALAGAGAGAWILMRRPSGKETMAKKVTYYCPMHPTIISDRPGECPICHMSLVPRDREEHAGHPETPEAPEGRKKRVIYRSTMNPGEVSDKPGKDSMGMDMVAEEVAAEQPAAGPAVEGMATVRIPTQKQQLIGVKTAAVTRAPFRRTIHAVGRVAFDETRLHHIHTKVAGFIEELFADATGEPVRKGQPLLEIYSPELLASQQEYLVALRARQRTASSTLPSVAASGEDLVASARRRLELFDVTEEQIQELESTGKAKRSMVIHAPMSGTVIKRNVTHGERVEPEMALLDMADLSKVWVLASVYEYELPFVRQGQNAAMTLSYLPGKTFQGRVSLIYPVLDAATRTAQVRVEFDNSALELKPDMYAEVELTSDLGERLAVPDTAVIDTGTRSIAFVDKGDGFFEPRELRIGLRLPELYEVLDGVSEGERVLTSANFYVDSESKLKAALAAMTEGQKAPPTAHPH